MELATRASYLGVTEVRLKQWNYLTQAHGRNLVMVTDRRGLSPVTMFADEAAQFAHVLDTLNRSPNDLK